MTALFPFEQSQVDQIVALWRTLHPEWVWLEDAETRNRIFKPSDNVERHGYVVQRDGVPIATVLGTCLRDSTWPRNRLIHIEARPEDITEWLGDVLACFAEIDRGQPDTWQVVNTTEALSPVLAPRLQATGFVHHSSVNEMEWRGDAVTVTDPHPAHLERYAGGDEAIDAAIVALHNRLYRPSRLVPPTDLAHLWRPWPGLEKREFVLAMEDGRLVGYAEWSVTDGKPYVSSLVVARARWGTGIAHALGARTMQVLRELGYHRLESDVRSNNSASIRLQLRLGWKVVSTRLHTFVRKLDERRVTPPPPG